MNAEVSRFLFQSTQESCLLCCNRYFS